MASTADAWLILLLGMVRTREVFTVGQLVQDMPILFLLCRIRKITEVRDVKHSLCLFVCPPSSRKGKAAGLSLSLSYRKLAKRANKLNSQR